MRAVLASGAMGRLPVFPAAAGALVFLALFLSDGSSRSRLFWIGVAAVVVAAVGWAWRTPRVSPAGGLFFAAFGAFVIWQGASIAWSIQPSRSWDYTNRGVVYFAFAAVGALLGGVSPRRLAQAGAVLLGALFAWALTAKVIPGLYSDYGRLARLRYPVGYWNELALLAAASVPLGLWLAGDARTDRRARIGGALLLYASLVVAVLTYSRVGMVLTVAAALGWLALERNAIAPLAVAWIVGAAVAGIGLLLPGVGDDGQSHHARVQDGLIFGAALILGAAVVASASRFVLARAVDRRLVRGVAAALAVLVLVALAGAVVRAGGPADFVRDRWHEFSNPVSSQIGNTKVRVLSGSSSNRWRWWQEAWNAFADHPLNGTGAGTFGLTDRLQRKSTLAVLEPHSAPLQDLSETGIVGFLLIAAAVAAAAVALSRRERDGPTLALALAAVLCVLHSLVDIDWDYVAVQGPLFLIVGALVARPAPRTGRRWPVAGAIVVCALAGLYSLASPWLADRLVSRAYDAFAAEDFTAAHNEAKSAHALNPLALEPLWAMALTERGAKALQLYRRARDLEPKNPETWYELGAFELDVLLRPRDAYRDLNHAYTLDRYIFGPGTAPGDALDRARCVIDPATCPK
jgi:tetratricopeptide (TPR) repeat protein